MKKIIPIIFLFSVLMNIQVKATHFTGGGFEYECVGQDSFLVTLSLLKDCSGADLDTTVNCTINSCLTSVAWVLTKQAPVTEVSQICPSMIGSSTCNGGTLFGVELHTYSGIVVLPSSCDSSNLTFQVCCRNDNVSNIQTPQSESFFLNSIINTNNNSCNSSPQVLTWGVPTIYLGQTSTVNLAAFDPEGDSLVYSLEPSFSSGNTSVIYQPGFSFSQPLGGTNTFLDTITGQLTLSPSALGLFLFNIGIEEYDRNSGQLKGKNYQEFEVAVINGNNNSPKFLPVPVNNLGDGSFVGETIYACLGDSLDFDITLQDSDLVDTVYINHNILSELDSSAIVTISGTNPVIVNVKWEVNHWGLFNFLIQGSDQGCIVPGVAARSFQVRIYENVTAGPDMYYCEGTTTILEGSGDGDLLWVVLAGDPIDTNVNSPNYNFSCLTCPNPEVSPMVTTTYILLATGTSNPCINMDTVTVFKVNSFVLDVLNDTAICEGESFALSANCIPSSANYSFEWSTTDSLSNYNVQNPIASPIVNSTYSVVVTHNNGCVKEELVNIDVLSPVPDAFSLIGDSIICVGDSTNLAVDFLPVGLVQGSCGLTPSVVGPLTYGIVGTTSDTTTHTEYPSIYGRFYWGNKHQIIYTASELSDMGLWPGNGIQSIGFDVVEVGVPNNMDNFSLRIGCTSDSVFSGSFISGLYTVIPSYTYLPVLGWNEHTFVQDFVWDGVSNIVVEICSNNSTWQTTATSTTKYSITSNNTVGYLRADNGTVCSSQTITTSNKRPITRFGIQNTVDSTAYNYTWTPSPQSISPSGIEATVAPQNNTIYSVIISDTLGQCSRTIEKLVTVETTPFDAGFSYDSVICEDGSLHEFIPFVQGGTFSGTGITPTGQFDPQLSGAGSWLINYSIADNLLCANDTNILIEVLNLPDATIEDVEVCSGSTPFNLQAATPGGYWSGTYIVDTILGTIDPSFVPPGEYEIYYSITQQCSNHDTGTLLITEPYQFTISNYSPEVCEGGSIDLSALVNLSTSPFQGTNPIISYSEMNGYVDTNGLFFAENEKLGNFLVTVDVSDSNGQCGTEQIIQANIRPIDTVDFVVEPSFCIDQPQAILTLNPWLFGAGVTFNQTPLGNLSGLDTLNIQAYGQNGSFIPSTKGLGSWEISVDYVNVYGCLGTRTDTIYVLNAPSNGVSNNGVTLTANAGLGYTYQWLDCDNNNAPIPGATNSTYTPGGKGNFAVQVSAGTCRIVSDCYETWPLGISSVLNSSNIRIYPNPVKSSVVVSIPYSESVNIHILDNTGKLIRTVSSTKEETTISMEGLSTGIYLIRVEGETLFYTEKLIKQ